MSRSLDMVLDTSRRGIVLGIYAGGETVHETCESNARGENLGRILDAALEQSQVALTDIKRVLVTLGPGSFTGLRTGIAFCQGLCFSGARSLFGISTLAALRSLVKDPATAVFLKARPGYWYLGLAGGEYFLSTEEALAAVSGEPAQSLVCDASAAADAGILAFAEARSLPMVPADSESVKPFTVFLDSLQPSLMQKANYIQPSYFERAR